MMKDNDDVEMVPLTSQLIQQRSTSFGETMGVLFYDDPSDPRRRPRDFRDFAFGVIVFAIGWFAPRYILQPYFAASIEAKPPPFQSTRAGDIIVDFLLNDPLVEPATIPSLVLIAFSVWLPFILVAAVEIATVPKRPAWALAAVLTTIGISEGVTQTLKLVIQRRRPNFYALCGFNYLTQKCTADPERIREAQYSFPSGHSSLSACTAVFLTWFLLAKLVVSRRLTLLHKRIASGIVCVLFLGWMVLVGVSRLVDHWHHPSDVLAGWLLGSCIATAVYHAFYYPIWHSQVAVPLS